MNLHYRLFGSLLLLAAIAFGRVGGQSRFADYNSVEHVLTYLTDALPSELKTSPRSAWPGWVIAHDREIRERLIRGDEDTVANWLLFGSSFTHEPRLLLDVSEMSRDKPLIVSRRVRDLITALASTHPDERSLFARRLLASAGYPLDSSEARA